VGKKKIIITNYACSAMLVVVFSYPANASGLIALLNSQLGSSLLNFFFWGYILDNLLLRGET